MVTRQILVLKFQVRALVEQQKKGLKLFSNLFFMFYYLFPFPHLNPILFSSSMRSLLSFPFLLRYAILIHQE